MRYLVFTYAEYYPSGGFEDYKGGSDNLQEAKKKAFEHDQEHKQIIDMATGESQVFIDGDWKKGELYRV